VRVLSIVHQADAGSGVFAGAVAARGHELDEWRPPESAPPELEPYEAVLVFGGGMHADQEDRHPWLRGEKELLRSVRACELPVLGVCLGSQLLSEAAGSPPRRAAEPEIGWHEVTLTPDGCDDPLLGPLPSRFEALQWHSYEFMLPPGALPLARSPRCLQAYRLPGRGWGLQFHAEVVRESVDGWLERYSEDEDAVRAGIEPDHIRAQTDRRISAWNELGVAICDRFLTEAESG
jgi:GMP synthase (glutamine-hydrolysing)